MTWIEIELPFKIRKPILALGADVKNSLCFAYNKSAFISEVIGDLQEAGNFNRFQNQIKAIRQRFHIRPRIIAYDLHPEYFSTKYVLSLPAGYYLRPIQHHHSHIASCMAENKLRNQKVLGIAFNGTGFGSDATLWGAEFFIADYKSFKRLAHLKYIPLLGGQRAIQEPWRIACAWLYLAFGDKFLDLDIRFLRGIKQDRWRVLKRMWDEDFNAPKASSIGRLFDAVAALVLNIYQVKFEAEAAIALEKSVNRQMESPCYPFKILKDKGAYVIDPRGIFKEIVLNLQQKKPRNEIAYRFHLSVAQMVKKICLILRRDSGINTVILSGGVFQNKVLLSLSLDLLSKGGFKIFYHRRLPCSDASICLGQAAIAAH